MDRRNHCSCTLATPTLHQYKHVRASIEKGLHEEGKQATCEPHRFFCSGSERTL
jgi:hypothetical protein